MKIKNSNLLLLQTLYGVDVLIVDKTISISKLNKTYSYVSGEDLCEDDSIAFTSACINRKTKKYTIIVKYIHDNTVKNINKKEDIINTIAHEAAHVAMYLYSFSGDKLDPDLSNEHFAYLVGYIAQHLYRIWTK